MTVVKIGFSKLCVLDPQLWQRGQQSCLNPLTRGIYENNTIDSYCSSYLTENTVRFQNKDQPVDAVTEIITI